MRLNAQKQAFIRWYAGHFHYQPRKDETFQFGLVISPAALRFRRAVRLAQRYKHWALAAMVVAIGVIAFS